MAKVTITFTYEGDGAGNTFVIEENDDQSDAKREHERARGESY